MKLYGHTKFVTSLVWEPLHLRENANHLISSSKDFTIRLWNTDSGLCERSFGHHTNSVTKVLWTGQNEIISGSEDQKIRVFDGNGSYLREMKQHSHWVNTMSLSTEFTLKRGCFTPDQKEQEGTKHERALKLYK